jgi:putative transposase
LRPDVEVILLKKSRFSQEQVGRIVSESERGEKSVEDLCREYGISSATLYAWKRRYRGLNVEEARQLRTLEQENARLKKLLAEREIELDAMKEFLEKKR